jgi:hypothetical protein
MNTKTTPPAAGCLEALAIEAENLGDTSQGQASQGPTPEEMNEQQAMEMVEKGMQAVVFAVFKMGRAVIARKLPEIRGEWTDDALMAPSQAAIPLLRKHLDTLMQIAGSSPEAAAFVIALVPLGMGVVNAMDKAAANADRTVEATAEPVASVG